MAPKIFLTGVTGYIGGEVFYSLYKAHPEYEYSLLVRNEEKGRTVEEKYPGVRLVYGTIDDGDILANEAAAADVVVDTADAADSVPSARGIAKGLAAGHSEEKPAYWIHLCGTAILCWYDIVNKRFGEGPIPSEKYGDITDVDRIVGLPDEAPHRDVDKVVLAASSPAVRTAIVTPPTIYGTGRGPCNTRSQQVPRLARFTLESGFAPVIGPGKTEWDNVHIHDLSDFYVAIVEAALDPDKNNNPELFGPKAYYFVQSAVHVWGEVSTWIAEEASMQGFLPAPMTKEVSKKEMELHSLQGFFEANSKSVGERARKYFGWAPKGPGLRDVIPEIVAREAELLKIEPKEKKA